MEILTERGFSKSLRCSGEYNGACLSKSLEDIAESGFNRCLRCSGKYMRIWF